MRVSVSAGAGYPQGSCAAAEHGNGSGQKVGEWVKNFVLTFARLKTCSHSDKGPCFVIRTLPLHCKDASLIAVGDKSTI